MTISGQFTADVNLTIRLRVNLNIMERLKTVAPLTGADKIFTGEGHVMTPLTCIFIDYAGLRLEYSGVMVGLGIGINLQTGDSISTRIMTVITGACAFSPTIERFAISAACRRRYQ
jgi:hypothetical protein